MKATRVGLIVALAWALAGGPDVEAQATDANWAEVRATVMSVFDFKIEGGDYPSSASPYGYDIGTVSHKGINGGAPTGNKGEALYTRLGAFRWSVESAPRRTVDIYMTNGQKTQEPNPGGIDLDRLSIRMTITNQAAGGTGSSQGLQSVTATRTDLIKGLLTGNGDATAEGEIDLTLLVEGNDRDGVNVWLVELVAEEI